VLASRLSSRTPKLRLLVCPHRTQSNAPNRATARNVEPAAPRCLPALRLAFPCNERGGGLANPSDDGGFEEFREFNPQLALTTAIRAACTLFVATRASFVATS
jgi:hypothetical protein